MLLFRPVKMDDVDQIAALAQRTGAGLTTLPKDPEKLAEKIKFSEECFKRKVSEPGPEYYLFVLQNLETGEVIGTSALASAVGLEQPFYTYKIGTTVHASPKLGIHKTIPTLLLGHDYTGTTEICTLFLSPDHRGGGAGKLLSKARFLYVKQFSERFADKIIAEMRGYSDENSVSPFWESLGRHFFDMEFEYADQLSGEESNEFIAELMPKYPIYLPFLSEEAQAVIGKVHPDTEPALDLLRKEGFQYKDYVDIFDAGPTVEVNTCDVETIKKSFYSTVKSISEIENGERHLISNNSDIEFRATLSNIIVDEEGTIISPTIADALHLSVGDTIALSIV